MVAGSIHNGGLYPHPTFTPYRPQPFTRKRCRLGSQGARGTQWEGKCSQKGNVSTQSERASLGMGVGVRVVFGISSSGLCFSLLPCSEQVLASNQNVGKTGVYNLPGERPTGKGKKGGRTLSLASSREAMDSMSTKRSDSAWAAWHFCWFWASSCWQWMTRRRRRSRRNCSRGGPALRPSCEARHTTLRPGRADTHRQVPRDRSGDAARNQDQRGRRASNGNTNNIEVMSQ